MNAHYYLNIYIFEYLHIVCVIHTSVKKSWFGAFSKILFVVL